MRLAIIVSHPIQYYSPWFRHLAAAMGCTATSQETKGPKEEETSKAHEAHGLRREVKGQRAEVGGPDSLHANSSPQQSALRVFYLWDFGVTEKADMGFGKTVQWDVDLLGGYDHEFIPNVSRDSGTHWFGGLDNPELLRRVRAFAPDVVLQFGYNYKSLVSFDLRWNTNRVPLLFRGDSHLLAEDREQGIRREAYGMRFKRWVRKLGLRLLFKRFACFLAVGKANADYIRAHGVPESKIVRCPHVVDNEFFRREPEETRGPIDEDTKRPRDQRKRGLRVELGIPENELVFLFAGKLGEKKQPGRLLEAFLAANLPKATLLFVGSGVLESELRSRVTSGEWLVKGKDLFENGSKRVVFVPFQNQSHMPLVYRTGDVLVLPSRGRYETWGLAVNEAACCGLPAIVSSHVGCGADLIEEGVTGWSFVAGNGESLRLALEKAASERDRLPEMGENLRKLVLSEFSYDRATSALLVAAARATHQGETCTSARSQ